MENEIETENSSRPLCIESFPDEVLVELFSYLSVVDLKNVMLTCHTFHDLVGQSIRLMRKFLLKITPKRKWDFPALTEFQRKHQNVKIKEFKDESLCLIFDGLRALGRNVKIFEISDCDVETENLLKILDCMRGLQQVTVKNLKVSGEILRSPELTDLKNLKVIESNLVLKTLINCKNLVEISLEGDEKDEKLHEGLQELLIGQKNLKVLKIEKLKFSDLFDGEIKFPFKLTHLSVHRCHFQSKEGLESFLASQTLLKSVEFSLNNLKLNLDRTKYYENSLKTVINLKNLEKLSIDIEEYNFNNSNFLQSIYNESVSTLSVRLEKTSCQLSQILGIFPAIKSLELSTNEPDIEFINKKLKNLNHLKVNKFPSESFGQLELKMLKSLHVNETGVELEHWMEFVGNHSNLTKLIINFTFFVELPENFIDEITKKLPKLEHVELIDKWIGMRNDIYVKVCENCPNLRYLKLWNINVEKDFDDSDKNFLRLRNVKFDLYNDESINSALIPF